VATPDELDVLSANLRGAYEAAWLDITTEQARIADDPARYARRSRLRELQAMVDDRLDQVDELAASWLADEFPTAYRLGAETTAGVLDQPFRWTTNDNDAVILLAQDTFDELLAATDGVSDSTKRLIRTLGKEQALLKAAAGKTATQAARQLRRLLEQQGIFSVRYKDGSRHGLADYTDMLLRTKTGVAHNAGGLNFARRAGTRWVEVFDGFDCGWFTHDDSDKANRSIRTVEEAAKATLSHPRCRRSFGPRPDITSPEQAKTAKSSITDAQQANQTAAERARRLDQRSRAAARRRQEARRARGMAPAARRPRQTPRNPADLVAERFNGFADWDDVERWADTHRINLDRPKLVSGGVDSADMLPMARAVETTYFRYPHTRGAVSDVTFQVGGMGEFAGARAKGTLAQPSVQSQLVVTGNRGVFPSVVRPGSAAAKAVPHDAYEGWLHEMGHVTHNITPNMRLEPKYAPDNQSMIREAMKDAGYRTKRGGVDHAVIYQEVSPYAAASDLEFFAETFTVVNRPAGVGALAPEAQTRLGVFRDSLNRRAGMVVL
jgi:hypothetical protein